MAGSPCPCRGCMAAYKQGYTDGFNEAQAANRLLNEMYGVKQDADSVHH